VDPGTGTGAGLAYRATTRCTWRRNEKRLQVLRQKRTPNSPKRLKEELEWVRQKQGPAGKSKARLQRYEEMAAEAERTRKLDFEEIQIPRGRDSAAS
jgi:hypothetical protein